ncbi:DUF5011 domain-containing protein [Stigmatella erecta]|uniref:Pesticidal crystal protein Cry22Aa Ig-like domain-containing protein n=1 Tax=Stigmatella erecta TaxID=83460 RepID=A0A1I0LBN0_9BACT|nr:DUF5011 domain-containing protein [Stigmatella erecta]SEU37540.1 protein of unknown function [Stigmatella erecta]
MGLHFNKSWKILIGTLGVSLVGCGGEALETPESLKQATQGVEGAVTLTLNGGTELNLECGVDAWSDPGATATDGDGGPLTVQSYNSGNDGFGPGPQASAEGTYYVSYLAHDADWNLAEGLRTVNVRDTLAPTLTLAGETDITHACGSNWVEPGYSASDACYGNLTLSVAVTNDVNGWSEGTYTVTYEVRDSAGHTASASRTVTVVDCPVYE